MHRPVERPTAVGSSNLASSAPEPPHRQRGDSSSSIRAFALVASACFALVPALRAGAQALLEINATSLTSYPAAASYCQLVRPHHLDRGVNIDGTTRAGSLQGWSLAANPFGEHWNANNRLQDIRLDLGAYNPVEVDLALPSIGVRWTIGRTYNTRQQVTTSNGYQGYNWYQSSQPELVRSEGATDADDIVYIVYGADRYLEFQRSGSTSDVYKGKNGTAGVIKRTAGAAGVGGGDDTPEKYEYIDQHGTVTTFFGEDYADVATWQIWKIEDTAGNKCYVGDSTSMFTAISSYADDSNTGPRTGPYGGILKVYDSADRRFTYTYTQEADGVKRLTMVKAETQTGGTWASPGTLTEVGKVEYAYYGFSQSGGQVGNLKLVTITTPLTTGSLVKKQYYRYYTANWTSTVKGHQYRLKMVLDQEGLRRFDLADDSTLNDSYGTANDPALQPYAALWLEYESSTSTRRISRATFNGECGCSSGGANGSYDFVYHANGAYTNNSGYDTAWCTRTVLTQPDSTYLTQYFDETGQPLGRVITPTDPASSTTNRWVTQVTRGAASPGAGEWTGCISEIRTPAANTAYTHDTAGPTPDGSITASGTVGLVHKLVRQTSGDLSGLLLDRYWKEGINPNSGMTPNPEYYDGSTTYTSHTLTLTSPGVVRPVVASTTQYTVKNSNSSGNIRVTDHSYVWHSTTSTDLDYLALKRIKTEAPEVTLNGPGGGTRATSYRYLNEDRTPSFAKAPDGIISFTKYDSLTGLPSMSIQDVDTSSGDLTGVTNPDSGVLTASGTAIHNKTTYTFDAQGRPSTTTLPSGRVTKSEYIALNDRRLVTLSTPRYVDTATDTFDSPASYSISNHMGKPEAQGTIAFSGGSTTTVPTGWVTTSGNEKTCISTGTVSKLTVNIYNSPGNQLTESRVYHNLSSFAGSSGTNYDATSYGFDAVGRRQRMVDPTSTIDRTVYDTLGRAIEHWTGTNDSDWPTNTVGNMVKTSSMQYDGGSAGGNSHLTSRSEYPDGVTGVRTTSFLHDARGRSVVMLSPQAPYTLTLYDNLGRLVAVGQYSEPLTEWHRHCGEPDVQGGTTWPSRCWTMRCGRSSSRTSRSSRAGSSTRGARESPTAHV